MKIIYDEKICVRCLACVSESEFGGVIYERGRIFFDETQQEDWANIISICPVAALKLDEKFFADKKNRSPQRTTSLKNFSAH